MDLFDSFRSTSHSPIARLFDVLLVVVATYSLGTPISAGAADDTCKEDGGPAYCVGPEVGAYAYQVSDGYRAVAQGTSEAKTINTYQQMISPQFCSSTLTNNLPTQPPVPEGHGSESSGDYNAGMAGTAQYWNRARTLSTEQTLMRMP